MLQIAPTYSRSFSNLPELQSHAQYEHDNTSYVPVHELYFDSDKYIIDKGQHYTFNEHAIKQLFSAVNVNGLYPVMMAVEEPLAASNYINKLVKQSRISKLLDNKQLIISNQATDNCVIGVVSKQYNKYSNARYLEDFIERNEMSNALQFERAKLKNTNLTINWLEEDYSGIEIDGKLDRSKIGFYAGNSMVGDAPVSSALSVFDTLCTNGMKIKIDLASMRIVHRGNTTMKWKLKTMLEQTKNQYDKVKDRLNTLLSIPYNDESAKKLLQLNAPISVIPELKDKKLWSTKKRFKSDFESTADLTRSINILNDAPIRYGGYHTDAIWDSIYRNGQRSMYHFLGSFTEYAQTKPADVQYQIEEEAGEFTSWVHKHKEAFVC